MSHDTHHADAHHTPANSKPGSSLTGGVWMMLILAFVFICAVNFVGVMSHDDGGHGEGHGTEHAQPAHGTGHDGHATDHPAPASNDPHAHDAATDGHETGNGAPAEHAPAEAGHGH